MARPIEIVRLGYGVAQLIAPRAILNTLDRDDDAHATQVGLRILGVRNVLQAIVLLSKPNWRRGGAIVDLVHAVTMVLLAIRSRKHRTAGALSAALSTIFAAAELS